jgi:glycine/serine hydroxymethyltransferase
MKEAEMESVGDLINEVISTIGSTETHRTVARKVEALCARFPLYSNLRP